MIKLIASHASKRHANEGVQVGFNTRSNTYMVATYCKLSFVDGLRSFNRHTGIATEAEARALANQVWVREGM